jgi:hypothetical protein
MAGHLLFLDLWRGRPSVCRFVTAAVIVIPSIRLRQHVRIVLYDLVRRVHIIEFKMLY